MRTPLKLAFPNSVAAADVRLALLGKRLIDCPDTQVRQDAARVLEIAIHESSGDIDCERAALCLAGLECVNRREGKEDYREGALTGHINQQHTLKEDKQSDVEASKLATQQGRYDRAGQRQQ
jgi:hypothetical protein